MMDVFHFLYMHYSDNENISFKSVLILCMLLITTFETSVHTWKVRPRI